MSGRVLITGGTGFIGRAVLARLVRSRWTPRLALRKPLAFPGIETETVGDLAGEPNWQSALAGCDAVIHLAARVHVLHETETDSEAAFAAVNAHGTERLAREARAAGVKRFIFISSVKAAAEASEALLDDSVPSQPESAYGKSKRAGEIALAAIEGLDVTILRAPLVFGPGVGAQFLRLLKLARGGLPLPFGAIRNARSLISVESLADAIVTALDNGGQRTQPFFVTGGPPLSTAELIRALRRAMNLPPRLVPVPPPVLRAGAALAGRSAEMMRLTESLALDDSRFRCVFGWSPPRDQETALVETARWFLETGGAPWQNRLEERR